MDKEKVLARAKIAYFFKETFRPHSKAEYREIFSRGLNENNEGVTGAFPWLYVRAFLLLFILFTVNTLVLRLTDNSLYVPSVIFLGGITFTVPFIVLLYELYPKRDLSILYLFGILVLGGTVAGVLSQLAYAFIPVTDKWLSAVVAGLVEEIAKAIPAMLAIAVLNRKNPYACFLVAAAVGAGFSVVEDMGYILHYSYVGGAAVTDMNSIVTVFAGRGLSTFCTHILWTGAVGWAYGLSKRPMRSFILLFLAISIALHICWDLPLEGIWAVLDIVLCVIIAAAINITIVHISRVRTLAAEVDLKKMNEDIIAQAKAMDERTRLTNAAMLTFAIACGLLSVIILLLCALPIGIDYQSVEYDTKDDFISFVEGEKNLKYDLNRPYDENGRNVEERWIEGVKTYVVQAQTYEGYEGTYYYGYYLSNKSAPDSVMVELDDIISRVPCTEYKFGSETQWVFEVNTSDLIEYIYESDGKVTAVINAEDFEGYEYLIALCSTGVAIAVGCNVILVAFRIKLRKKTYVER